MKKKFLTLFGTALTLALASNVAVAQSPSGESTSAPSDIKMSPEGMEILCKNFPMNSRCGGGAAQAQPTSPSETPAEGTSGRMNRRTTPEAVPAPGATDGPVTPAPVPPPGATDSPSTPTSVPAPAPGNMNIPPGTPVPGPAPDNMTPPGSSVPTPTPGATDSPSGSPTEAPAPDSMTAPGSSDKPEASPSTEKKPRSGADSTSPTSPSGGKN
jgi:hypothetical protein